MTEGVYRWDGRAAHASAHAAGPWDPSLQHGSAPAALVAWVAERMGGDGDAPMHVVRLTLDLMRPVPVAPLEIETEVLRRGRKIQLCGIRLVAGGVDVVRATALKMRSADLTPRSEMGVEALDLPGVEASPPPDRPPSTPSPFFDGISTRVARGDFGGPGPKALWYRVDRPIIEGEPISPLMRAAITADFCNGTSAVLDAQRWSYINGDLTLSLTRTPVGEWLLLDATTWLSADGSGVAFGRLADGAGYFGRVAQSLLIDRR
jgi:hypothetical protein